MGYPSDISREQFEQTREILESARKKTKPRKVGVLWAALRAQERLPMADAAEGIPEMADSPRIFPDLGREASL
ncbi:hypothetical protein MGMO_47c00020 [Methyloglobulus morosus KoM1]|uniref:Uncharacterized protein n=1 Tax=Methyloglobulus morosus KoM1 TaxID=1116472 RepID=V5BHF1_9GAMM|nr:hypothetical protein MGMO_47c00020 [Methyloglobulus morosus KoM1]